MPNHKPLYCNKSKKLLDTKLLELSFTRIESILNIYRLKLQIVILYLSILYKSSSPWRQFTLQINRDKNSSKL